jgi:hypothetical protein
LTIIMVWVKVLRWLW